MLRLPAGPPLTHTVRPVRALRRMLDPPEFASGYQGSALIAASAPSSAHGSRSGAGTRA
jgi:hypothetical protein